jgi:hypothetical protein
MPATVTLREKTGYEVGFYAAARARQTEARPLQTSCQLVVKRPSGNRYRGAARRRRCAGFYAACVSAVFSAALRPLAAAVLGSGGGLHFPRSASRLGLQGLRASSRCLVSAGGVAVGGNAGAR